MPKVSVIVPNYNHAAYLTQRLESVLNQSFQDFELIILDDCSSDNSKDIIDQYARHPRVSHIVYNEQNSGSTFNQWEKGIRLAQGEWIWIAESDDWSEPDFLQELVFHISAEPGVNLAFSQLYLVDEHSQRISAGFDGESVAQLVEGTSFVKINMLPFTGIWNASQAIFRKSSYYKLSPEYLNYKFCGDWIFWSEIGLQGQVMISAKFHTYFRKHGLDVTSKATQSGLRFKEELKTLLFLDKLLGGYVRQQHYIAFHFSNFYSVRGILPTAMYREIFALYADQISFKERIKKQIRAKLGALWKK
ncbi:glycosyltransferase family 2 protein [Pedobacter cryoconitis]|uniref:Glycosyltransferase involved in cell wall biosynthesis n=1 Tax=Pedobacter cryoconitis TaxID=188932 RepID=A0A7X0ML18_9SPHI|nr:glycosyltransferase [Pedobacter cryoconitis]MBB6500973.1 glycosyltransferase involved in cell wall biosynthesis [Pedobacter cryoconitis]